MPSSSYLRRTPGRPQPTPAQWDEIAQRYADGETATSLAVAFGVKVAAIRNRVVARQPGAFRPRR